MTSGSSRIMERSPRVKSSTSRPSSRCEIMELRWGKIYSMGSSSVMMRQARFSLMRWMSEAMVVLLPAPVMPVKRQSPCFRRTISCQQVLGKPIFSGVGMSLPRARMAAVRPSLSRKALIRNCSEPYL